MTDNHLQEMQSKKVDAIKKGTKPFKYPEPKDLQKVIDKYFAKTPEEEWTVTGLALLVGTKDLLISYTKRPGFKDMIQTAKLKIECAYEKSLRKNGRSGDIFALKNFGWVDKQELKHGGELKGDSTKVVVVHNGEGIRAYRKTDGSESTPDR
jgi:hypothetical protein